MQYSSKNLESLINKIAKSDLCELVTLDNCNSIKTINSVWPNKLFNVSLDCETLDEDLNHLEKLAINGDIPQTLACPPDEVDQKLIQLIQNRGYKQGYWLAMAMQLPFQSSEGNPKNLELLEIENENEMHSWCRIVESDLMAGGHLDYNLILPLLNDDDCFFFSGKVDGETVTASMLLAEGKEAGIYLIATKEKFRGKGYGTAITNICIEKAKELDIEAIFLQATQKGESIYRKMGFKDCGRIELFKLKEKAES